MARLCITLDIPPGDLAINRRLVPQHNRHRQPTGRLILRKSYRAALEEAALVVRQACIRNAWPIATSNVCVTVVTHWRTARGDAEATTKAVCDALEQGGCVANDKLCKPLVIDAVHGDKRPRIEITVEAI